MPKSSKVTIELPVSPVAYKIITSLEGDVLEVPGHSFIPRIIYPHLSGKKKSCLRWIVNDTGGWPTVKLMVNQRDLSRRTGVDLEWKSVKEISNSVEEMFRTMAFIVWNKADGQKSENIFNFMDIFNLTEEELNVDSLHRDFRRSFNRIKDLDNSILHSAVSISVGNVKS